MAFEGRSFWLTFRRICERQTLAKARFLPRPLGAHIPVDAPQQCDADRIQILQAHAHAYCAWRGSKWHMAAEATVFKT